MKKAPLYIRRKTRNVGLREGIAKGLSNVFAYGTDSRKTLYQLHGFVPVFPKDVLIKRWTTGLSSSCICTGFIYYIYFAIYNRLLSTPFAGPLSALAISTIKLPIYNGIKVMQSGCSESILGGVKYLSKSSSIYNGYFLSLCEDTIELDLKTRLYNGFKRDNKIYNICIGTLSSVFASAVTTPFDNVRLQMCVKNKKFIEIVRELVATRSLYKGVCLRMKSNITKNIGFFVLFEFLKF
jgi:hypothetical protein